MCVDVSGLTPGSNAGPLSKRRASVITESELTSPDVATQSPYMADDQAGCRDMSQSKAANVMVNASIGRPTALRLRSARACSGDGILRTGEQYAE